MTRLEDIIKADILEQKVELAHQWNLERGFDRWFVMPNSAMAHIEQLEARIGHLHEQIANHGKNNVALSGELIARRQTIKALEARITGLEGALTSIANNTCCGTFQEAKLVARAALAGERREERGEDGKKIQRP